MTAILLPDNLPGMNNTRNQTRASAPVRPEANTPYQPIFSPALWAELKENWDRAGGKATVMEGYKPVATLELVPADKDDHRRAVLVGADDNGNFFGFLDDRTAMQMSYGQLRGTPVGAPVPLKLKDEVTQKPGELPGRETAEEDATVKRHTKVGILTAGELGIPGRTKENAKPYKGKRLVWECYWLAVEGSTYL